MINFKNMVKALKISWIKGLFSPNNLKWKPKWKTLTLYMSSINDISQLTYKLGTDLIKKNIPKFHKQMLECWFEFFSVEPSTMQVILNEKLCLNKFILIQGRPIRENYNLIKKTGITNLGQLVNKNTFKTIRQLEAEYSCSLSQFQLNSLLSAIPSSWKKVLKDKTDFTTGPLYDLPGMKINIPKLTNQKDLRDFNL